MPPVPDDFGISRESLAYVSVVWCVIGILIGIAVSYGFSLIRKEISNRKDTPRD